MEMDQLLPFVVAALTMWGTPGPNNMMLAYSGARFGLWRTLPHISGVVVGNTIINVIGILGLSPVVDRWPEAGVVLQVFGSAWLFWVGARMALSTESKRFVAEPQPMRFLPALLFQFSNPKAIAAASSLTSLVIVAARGDAWIWFAALCLIPPLGLLANGPWAVVGTAIRRYLSSPTKWRVFGVTTGLLTASCAIFLWV
jgi:threonine/homoserine/homoserine lactone efflux protein